MGECQKSIRGKTGRTVGGKKFWDLPMEVKSQIMKELEERFGLLFTKLRVLGTRKLVQEMVKPLVIKHQVSSL